MEHKKQHWVPESYLTAWCDPGTPADQEPYVWRFSKDGVTRTASDGQIDHWIPQIALRPQSMYLEYPRNRTLC